jgi:hypothetical protein
MPTFIVKTFTFTFFGNDFDDKNVRALAIDASAGKTKKHRKLG